MKIWETIKRFKLRQLFVLSKTLLKNPTYILPTYNATRKTLKICDEKFGKTHHKNNKANAFRHALWNFLIAKKCFKSNNSVEKSINWTIKITDLHEKLSPNHALAKAMDLHNNKIGRELFQENISTNNSVVKELELLMKVAKYCKSLKEIATENKNLVYIESE